MQDENVACHDLGKVSFERAVSCFGTPQLERATHFTMPQLERATRFSKCSKSRSQLAFECSNSSTNDRQFEVCVFDFFFTIFVSVTVYAFHVSTC